MNRYQILFEDADGMWEDYWQCFADSIEGAKNLFYNTFLGESWYIVSIVEIA